MKSVLLISHGSRSPKTIQEVKLLCDKLKNESTISIFEFAFLELESPSIPEGIDHCVKKGATEVLILLNFLNSGRHVDEDIPEIVNDAKAKHPNVVFKISAPVGQHPEISNLFIDLIS